MDEILGLFAAWDEALQTGDPDRLVALYDRNAVLIPTLSNDIRTDHAEIRAYFVTFIQKRKPKKAEIVEPYVRLFGDIAVNSGLYRFYFDMDPQPTPARYTFVYKKTGRGWTIVEHHSSPLSDELKGTAVFKKFSIE